MDGFRSSLPVVGRTRHMDWKSRWESRVENRLAQYSLRDVPVVGCGSTTIRNAADADALRQACPIIQGNITFDGVAEDISLDGIQTVLGNITNGFDSLCDFHYHPNCTVYPPFTISSQTLSMIDGNVDFWGFSGLDKLLLPNLTTITHSLSFYRMENITSLDITKLTTLGSLLLDAPNLKTFQLDGLQNFTGVTPEGIGMNFYSGGMESLDGLLKNPLTMPTVAQQLQIPGTLFPNLKEVTIGWPSIDQLSLGGNHLNVTLGGPFTTSMNITTMSLEFGVGQLDRGSQVLNLEVGTLIYGVFEATNNITRLTLPFERLGRFEVSGDTALQTLELPSQASNWTGFEISLSLCPNLYLNSTYRIDDQGKNVTTWYWPRGDISEIALTTNMTTAFL